jgi:hypothetical protein
MLELLKNDKEKVGVFPEVLWRPFVDEFVNLELVAKDYQDKLRKVVQPAQAQANLDAASNYAKVERNGKTRHAHYIIGICKKKSRRLFFFLTGAFCCHRCCSF